MQRQYFFFLGYGTGGSYFDAINEDFPSVPYTASDFNDAKCSSGSGNIENYGDANQVSSNAEQEGVGLNW